jgi:hypothetical protein
MCVFDARGLLGFDRWLTRRIFVFFLIFLTTTDARLAQAARTAELFFLRDGNIWSATANGENQKQITHDGYTTDYFFIRNQNTLVFDRVIADKLGEIKSLNLANGTVERLYGVQIPEGEDQTDLNFYLSVSPDGNKISYFDNASPGVTIQDLQTKIEKKMPCSAYGFAFSPDGLVLAVNQNDNVTIVSLKDYSQKPLTRMKNAGQAYLSGGETIGSMLGWLPDGKNILYYQGTHGLTAEAFMAISQVDLGGHVSPGIPAQKGEEIHFLGQSSDRREIYYVLIRYTPVGSYQKEETFLRRWDWASGKTEEIRRSQFQGSLVFPFHLNEASSDSQVVYDYAEQYIESGVTRYDHSIWVMNPDGTENHKIMDKASNPKWKD